MRSRYQWIVALAALGILGALYPLAQKSLQPVSRENFQSQAQLEAATSAKTTPTEQPETLPAANANLSPEAQTIYAQVNPAVVTVYSVRELGSGMIVRSQGLVLTNKHLVQNLARVKVKTSTGQVYDGAVVDFDLQYDLALIKLDQTEQPLPTVALAETVTLQTGDRLYAIGNPAGKPGVLSSGTFVQTTEHGSLQISAGMLAPGNSGGPLINTAGLVVGINKGLLADKTGLATAVKPLQTLIQRYESINSEPARQPKS